MSKKPDFLAYLSTNLHVSWLEDPVSFNLPLFSRTLTEIKREILRFLGLKRANPENFAFSLAYSNNTFAFSQESDFYFFVSLHLQSFFEKPFEISVTRCRKTKVSQLQEQITADRPSEPLFLKEIEVFCEFCRQSSRKLELIETLGPFYGPFRLENREVFSHERCAIWSPAVYLDIDGKFVNLLKEMRRASREICSFCGLVGASLGCFVKKCARNYHFLCSLDENLNCALDFKGFTLFCPQHLEHAPEKANCLIYEEIFCEKCGGGDDDGKIVICEKCLKAAHIYCLEEKTEEIPQGDWLCEKCRGQNL